MGSQSTRGTLEAAGEGQAALPLGVLLHWHLTANHYPPLPVSLIPACRRAIDLAAEGDYDAKVRLPRGLITREGKRSLPVREIVQMAHLLDFVEVREYELYGDDPNDADLSGGAGEGAGPEGL
jgi:hypothetical protein